MKKALSSLLPAFFLLLMLCPIAWGAETSGYILGEESMAELLTVEQAEDLETAAAAVSEAYGCGVYIAVMEDYRAYWDTLEDSADWLYKEYFQNRQENGILLALSMADRSYCLHSYGSFGRRAFTDEGKSSLENMFLADFKQDSWYAGFGSYLEGSAILLEAASSGNPIGEPSRAVDTETLQNYGIAAVISVMIAFAVCEAFRREMKTAREAAAARGYVPADGVNMRVRQDRYINTTVDRVKIEARQKQQPGRNQNQNSGGSGHF